MPKDGIKMMPHFGVKEWLDNLRAKSLSYWFTWVLSLNTMAFIVLFLCLSAEVNTPSVYLCALVLVVMHPLYTIWLVTEIEDFYPHGKRYVNTRGWID